MQRLEINWDACAFNIWFQLTMKKNLHFENYLDARRFYHAKMMSKRSKLVERSEWVFPLMLWLLVMVMIIVLTVNFHHNAESHEISPQYWQLLIVTQVSENDKLSIINWYIWVTANQMYVSPKKTTSKLHTSNLDLKLIHICIHLFWFRELASD
jgi:hypothetical protein